MMTDLPLQSSIINKNSTIVEKRKQLSSNNLFNNLQRRSHSMSGNATLPIITLSSFSNVKKKFIRMAANNKSPNLSNIPNESRMTQIKSRTRNSNRSNVSIPPKSSFNYPPTITRPTTSYRSNNQQQNTRLLYVVNSPISSYRTVSAHISNNNLNSSSSQQQQQQQPMLSRPYSQYEHFLAYLRRQSLARLRRKQQQEEEGNTNHIETTITLNLNKHPSIQSFVSSSNYSLLSQTTDTSSIPTISIASKRAKRPLSSYNHLQRSLTTFRLNPSQQSPLTTSKNSIDDQLLSSSVLVTPRNSIVDDITISPIIKPSYDLHLNDDMLNYCYISSDSGVKYQGEMLSTAV